MKDSIRKRIVEKARDLLFKLNEEEITMNLIANKLGITAPTLYHYFKGKDELLGAANQLITEEISAQLAVKFPPSIPFEMRIVTVTSMLAEYFMRTGIPASYLIENPKDRPVSLDEFRHSFTGMFTEFKKSGKVKSKLAAEHMTFRYLSSVAGEIAYLRAAKKDLPSDLSDRIFTSFMATMKGE